jgi:hypothetical protein
MKFNITYRYEARSQPARKHPSDSSEAWRRLCDGNHAFAALFKTPEHGQDQVEMVVPLDLRDVGLLPEISETHSQRPFAAVLG